MPCSRQSLLDHITVQLAPRAADEIWYGEGQVRKPSTVHMQMIQNPWREEIKLDALKDLFLCKTDLVSLKIRMS
jgi:hypothetical protein